MQRPIRQTARPWKALEQHVVTELTRMAKDTLAHVALGGAAGQGGYNVTATIMPDNVTGQYNSSTGVHAEIDAITNLGAVANNKTITTNKEPCSRCAAILYLYRNQHAWTIQAPVNDRFAKDYAGAYHIPDAILNAMIDHLVNQGGIMSAYEGQHYKTEVKNAIDNLNV